MPRVTCLAALLLAVAGCSSRQSTDPSPPPPPDPTMPDPTTHTPPIPADPGPAPTPTQASSFADSINAFGLDLWGQVRSRPGNLVVSPASISLALAMTWGGARGETATQMGSVMHFGSDADALQAAAAHQLAAWNDPARTVYALRVANRLFGERSYRFEPDYLALTRDRYGAALEPMDFRGAAEPSRSRINGWVEERTARRIRELLPARSIASDTKLVLVNAVYFLGSWSHPFDEVATRPLPFLLASGQRADVPTMRRTEYYRTASQPGVRALEMPYRGDELAMVILVPDDASDLATLEQSLTAQRLAGVLGALAHQRLEVFVPRFRVDPPQSLALATVLASMGMTLPFDRARADFTGIANPPSPADRLFISQVFHKAFVDVNEEGTEAAAATAVVMAPTGAAPAPPQRFAVDRPFLFLIRDLRSGAMLFLGRVIDPRAR